MNLVVNAAEAMLEVDDRRREVLRTRLDGGYIRVEVSDAGVGVPPEEKERIFSAFHTHQARRYGHGSLDL